MSIALRLHEQENAASHRAYFFGPFRLFRGSATYELHWRRNKAKSLLKWFILNQGKLFSADQLIDLFWPDMPPESAFKNLYVTIHYLRRLLEPELTSGQQSSFIRRNANNFYWFEMDESWWVDVLSLHHLLDQARELDRRGETMKATFYYQKIVNYCERGFLSEDSYEQCFQIYRQKYDLHFSQALARLIQIYLQQDDLERVLEYSHQALQVDPYCEQAASAIVKAHFLQGNVPKALKQFDNFHSFLQEELGLDPSEEFCLLREMITRGR
jgi:DNA-binding SARP family transcriptional activator